MIGNWLDLSSTTNRHISTYVKGFVDISGGNLILRNNNIYVNSGDISLSGVLLVGKDASFNSKLTVGGDVSLNSKLSVSGLVTLRNDASFNSKLIVGGDVSLNSKLSVSGLVTLENDKAANLSLLEFSNTNNSLNKVKFVPYLGSGGYNYISSLNDFGFIFGNSNNAATGSFVIAPHTDGLKGFKVTKDGYVGIGVVSPTQALDVSGNTKVSGNVIVGNNLTLSQSFAGPITINPNSVNANKTTWTSNGVTWNVLASTNDASIFRETWEQFDSLNLSTAWGTSTASYRAGAPFEYTANTYATSIYFPAGSKYFGTDLSTENTYATAGFRDISGEWLQISGNKHILKSFTMINESSNGMQPALYFICGSNDGYSFYPIVNVTYSGTWGLQETELSQLTVPTSSSVSTTSATSLAKESLNYKYHSYGYGTTAFIYFRMVIIARIGDRLNSNFNTFDGYCYFREWKPYFDTYTDTLTIQTKENNNNMVLNIKGGVKISGANSGLIIASGDVVSQGYNFIGFGYGSPNGTINRWRIEEITLMRDHGRAPYYDYAVQSKLIFSTKTNGLYNNTGNDESYSYGLTLMPNNIGSGNPTNAVNVGIGTTNPSQMLDVNGSFTVGGQTTLTGSVSGTGPILRITANSTNNICNSTAGNGGLDDFQSKAPFSIFDSGFNSPYGIGLKMGIWRDTGSAYIQCEGANTGARNICLQTYSGKVGIGTTEPLEILDIGNNSFRITTPFTLSSITPNINNIFNANNWTKFHEEDTADFVTNPNNYNNAPRILRWATSASNYLSETDTFYHYSNAFDNDSNTAWLSSQQIYAINTGVYTGGTTLNTLNQSNVVVTKNGEFLNIIAPSPVQLMSYTLTCRNTGNFPREFSILGSLNNNDWYLIQDVSFNATCPVADGVTTNSISLASNQTAVAFGSSTITSVIYGSNTTKKYTYFRIIIGRIYGSTANATRVGFIAWRPTFNMSISNVKLSVDSALPNTLRIEGGLNVTENLRIRSPLFNDSFTYSNICRKSAFKIVSGTYTDDFLCIGQWASVTDSNNPIGYIQTSWDVANPYIYNQVLALQPLYGKVGIGTTNPAGGLHINVATNNSVDAGAICTPYGTNITNFLPNLYLKNSSTLGSVAGNFLTHLTMSTSTSGNNQILSVYNHRNTAGTDWLGTSMRIQSTIDATNQGYIEFNPPGFSYGIGLYTGASGNLDTRINGITIDTDGRVLIVSPETQLKLKNTTAVYNGGISSIRFQCGTDNNPMGQIDCQDVSIGPSGTYVNNMRFWVGRNTVLLQRMIIKGENGYVGIGTVSPTQLLEVADTIRANGNNATINKAIVLWDGGTSDDVASATNFLGFGHNNYALRYNVNASTTDHVFYAGSTELMRIKGTGYVGIGMNPSSPLSIKGVDESDNPSVNGFYCINDNGNSNSHATLSLRVNANGGNPFVSFDVINVTGWSIGMDNADSEKFKISSAWSSVSTNTRLTITTGGNVGIGTASPSAKLQVTGTDGNLSVASYFQSHNGMITSGISGAFSIYADGPIGGSYVGAHSDKRIKTNIIDIDDETSLNILRLLKPKKYNYIDKVNRSINDDFGFIAQDLKEVFPCSVCSTTEFIPNIYEIGTVSVDRTILTLTSKSINDISMNDSSVIIKFYDHTNKEIIKEIEHFIDEKSFKLKTEFEITDLLDNKIFVYGQKVDDFLSLSKDAITCITTAAIQQIDRIVLEVKETIETQQTLIQTEKAKVAILETQLTDVLARLSALENK